MDNLTHSLCAAALARTALGRRSPLSTPALLLAANLPDIDLLVAIVGGWPAYLVHHRGVTHSLAGLVVQALLLGALLARVEPWWERRRSARARGRRATLPTGERPATSPAAPGASRWGAFPAIAAGLLSHLLLDALNTYGVRPWLPFDGTRYYADAVHIVDPCLWLIFGGAALWARGRHRDRVLAAAAALALLYVGGRSAAAHQAWSAARERLAGVSGPVLDHVTSPDMLDPLRWSVVAATAEELHQVSIHLAGADGVPQRHPRHLDDPRVMRAAERPEGHAWKVFARLPLGAVTPLPAGGARVDLMDGRYHLLPGPAWSTLSVQLSAADLHDLPAP